MDCRYTNKQWKIVYLYIGTIAYLQKRILNLYRKNTPKKMKKTSSMKKYHSVRYDIDTTYQN